MQHNLVPVQKCTKGSFGSPFSIHTTVAIRVTIQVCCFKVSLYFSIRAIAATKFQGAR